MESPERLELPAAFEDVDVDVLVKLIADMMERLIAHNDRIPLTPESLTRFHSRTAPGISVLDYLRRIVRFTRAERSCLLITLHYIDQISVRMPAKCLCDAFCSNSVYAKVGGIPVAELNVLEREFLRIIDWHLTCTRETLQEYYVNLVRTYSRGGYVISDAQSSSSGISSDSDMDCEMSPTSSPQPPSQLPQGQGGSSVPSASRREPSTVLKDTATIAPGAPQPPTLEQNMAFAALRKEQELENETDMDTA